MEKAIEFGKIIAPYCFLGNFLDTKDTTRDYSENRLLFYKESRQYIENHPGSEFSNALIYKGPLYRLSPYKAQDGAVVSWAYTDYLFQEWECCEDSLQLQRFRTDTGADYGISIEGLACFLKGNGQDVHDIKYWTGITPEQYFEEHPFAECIATVWDTEKEVLFPYNSQSVTIG